MSVHVLAKKKKTQKPQILKCFKIQKKNGDINDISTVPILTFVNNS